MAAGKKGANGAAEINASAIVLLKKLGGVAAPANYRFLALTMEMRNILEAQEVTVYPDGSSHPSAWLGGGARGETKLLKIPYLIPDFISHFSLTYNNGGAYPASLATWLAGKPLFAPGDNALIIMPEESITGTLVFLVPDTPMEQLSLHFYDLNYGHIDLPLVGEMRPRSFTLASLPKQEPTSLTDAFTLEITAWDELAEIPGTGKDDGDSGKEHGLTPGAGAVFKVVEGNFTSRLQALLQVDPLERFSLRLKTASGDFYLPVHPATSLLPAGFANPRMLYPGSFNRVRWLFEIPGALRKNTAELHVELRGEDKAAPVATGEMLPGNLNARYSSEFMELTVNDLVKTDSGLPGEYVIADLTIHDKKDGLSSSGIASLFSLVPDAFWEADPAKTAQGGTQGPGRSACPERLILGFTEESVVYDGTSRRGIIVFQLPPGAENEWYLYGETFAGLKLKVRRGSYSQGLLAEKAYYDEGDNFFAQNLNAAIGLAVERHRLQHPEKTVQLVRGNIPLGEPAVDKQEIPPPALSFYGAQLLKEINSVDVMVRAMKRLRYLPSPGSYGAFNYNFAREAVLTQGFGTEQDYAHLAVELLSRMGYQPKLKVVRLTERGRKELAKMSGITEIALDRLPAVAYVDQNNNHRILVMPFLEELEDLKRLVYLDHTPHLEKAPNKIWLEINAYGYATDKGAGEQLGELAGALAGETEGAPGLSSRLLYSDQLALDLLSLDAVDIGIARDGNRARIYLITAAGEIFGGQYVELDRFEPRKLEFVFSFPNQTRTVHLVRLDEGMEIDDVFITAGINAPDLTPEASKKLQEVADRVYSLVKNPGELSALRWYGRSIIARFISAQTLHDRSLSRELGLTVGRTTRPRVVVVTHKGGKKLRTSLNLLAVHDQVHAGEESRIKTFNMLSGIFASTLEAAVLPGQGSGLAQIWLQAPQGTELVFLEHLEQDARLALERAGASPEMIEHLAQTPNMVLIASKPALIDGYRHWAWFEIDTRTWEMLSVIDTLEKGAFVESTLVDTVRSAGQYAAGAFKGIETSIWSVAKYSLENDDYQEILQAARALALGLAERFGFNMGPLGGSIGGTLSISQTVGPVKFSFDGSASASQNVLGFTEGFRAGVEYYFRRAR